MTCRQGINDFLKKSDDPVEEAKCEEKVENGRKIYTHHISENVLKSFREKDPETVYNMPTCDAVESAVISPFVFPNGINVDVTRRGAGFSYYIFVPETIEVQSTADSILLLLCESLRLHCGFPFWVTAIVNEQSIFFDGEKIVLRNGMSPTVVIKADGTLMIKHKNMIPLIVEPNGTVNKKIKDQWTKTDSEGNLFKNGKQIGNYTFLPNHTVKEKSMIRPDQIEFAILNDGTRRVLSNQEFCVQHGQNFIYFDVPGYPRIKLENGVFSIQIDSFPIDLSTSKRVSLKCEAFEMSYGDEVIDIKCPKCEFSGSTKFCKLSADDCNLSVNSDGEEIFDVPESFSPTSLFKKNPPRFFAITANMAVCEFIREDDQILDGSTRKTARIPYMSGMSAKIQTIHFADETVQPLAFVENDPVTPEDIQNLEEVLKDDDAFSDADANQSVSLWLDDVTMFESSIDAHLQRAHDMFLEDQFHGGLYFQDEDAAAIMPPPTLAPRLLDMAYRARDPTVFSLEPGDTINYWQSHESDFAMPIASDGTPVGRPDPVPADQRFSQFHLNPRAWS